MLTSRAEERFDSAWLEVELKGKLYDSPTALIENLAKVVDCVVGKSESLSRITGTYEITAIPIGHHDSLFAHCIESKVNVTGAEATGWTNNCRIGLVEDVKEACPELKLLVFAYVEVLKEGYVPVAPTWRSQIKRRLRWSRIGERRNR